MHDSASSRENSPGGSHLFPPSSEFSAHAHVNSMECYQEQYERSVCDPEQYWDEQAKRISWFEPWSTLRKWDYEKANIEWFTGGKLNACYNCVDLSLIHI